MKNQSKSEFIRVRQSLSEFVRVNQNKSELERGDKVNRLGFIVLSILRANSATNKLSSMSVREITQTEDLEYKENTIFKKIKEFEQSGYIGRGLKEGRADTFYITDSGCEFLETEKN
ncbi:hypothetical protein [Anaerocolumna xylanovorans]|uniref:Winged helix DNA-binding domain-containing protein n=1 Tax=Anaerocolumna xylanovorans DSM 12503 TaxID=1121345 RepID=A0A1M7YC34_9FIRM|nr:hypothetical protein [Anaerocolumna xylanovorans]SHO50151.1 hypothetical protein SAMN02745217_02607 [Anaerocolumna xylanovorans DSM 12503]